MNMHENGFLYQYKSHCNLIAFLNYLKIKYPFKLENFSKELYDELVELSGAANGSCIRIGDVYNKYGVFETTHKVNRKELERVVNMPQPFPFVIDYVDPLHYSHSSLVVDYNHNNKEIKLINSGFKNDVSTIDELFWWFDLDSNNSTEIIKIRRFFNHSN